MQRMTPVLTWLLKKLEVFISQAIFDNLGIFKERLYIGGG